MPCRAMEEDGGVGVVVRESKVATVRCAEVEIRISRIQKNAHFWQNRLKNEVKSAFFGAK